MTNILEKIDNYLTEATKPTFEEYFDKNIKIFQRYWQKRKDWHESNYEEDENDDGSSGMLPEQVAEENAYEDTIKKFKNKFAYNRNEIYDYIETMSYKFGG